MLVFFFSGCVLPVRRRLVSRLLAKHLGWEASGERLLSQKSECIPLFLGLSKTTVPICRYVSAAPYRNLSSFGSPMLLCEESSYSRNASNFGRNNLDMYDGIYRNWLQPMTQSLRGGYRLLCVLCGRGHINAIGHAKIWHYPHEVVQQ